MTTITQRSSASVSRRGFLRGAGISLALPRLESLPVRAAETGTLTSQRDTAKPPVRFAGMYFSNGVEPVHWWARGRGWSMIYGSSIWWTSATKPATKEIYPARALFDGDKHQADEMPIVLAGRGAGSLQTGRVLDYLNRGDDNRRACSLSLSLMDRMGVVLPRFGNTQQRLANL